ncbi:dUTP diphosphatase [archaeon CG10_big_fil_rev_8_21_14_0_10_43_11]|nr:MAG: dUTP diphosphatase [archaeon CG10_big_fil_rev_8_21_14_0_10_43_11]
MELKIFREDKTLPLPQYQTSGSSGFDLHSAEEITIKPGEFRGVCTGMRFAIPHGFEGQVRPRSGLALKKGISVVNTPGTLDSDYRGLLYVILINHGKDNFFIKKGDRIAQMVINKVEFPRLVDAKSLDTTERGEGGFGSTGT